MTATKRPCSVTGCNKPRRALSFCPTHYKQWHDGRPLAPIAKPTVQPHACQRHKPGTASCYSKCGDRCAACRKARERERKQVAHGLRHRVDATGTRRRLQALAALGIPDSTIAERLGCGRDHIKDLRRWPTTVRKATADAVARTYDALSMVRIEHTAEARKRRTVARNRGWVPPLSWDEGAGPHGIDNPDATPVVATGRRDVIGEIRHLASQGAGIQELMAQLGVTRSAIDKACRRAGDPELWQKITREAA